MDLETLRGIAELMKENDITRIKLEEGEIELEIERGGGAPVPAVPPAAPASPAGPAPAPAQGTAAAGAGVSVPAGAPVPSLTCADGTPCDPERVHEVCAPMVGVFYAAPAPGAEPFVRVGSTVKKGDTLCILEAMKLMNEVVAEHDGEVVEVCCEDGELAEYGRVLFKVY